MHKAYYVLVTFLILALIVCVALIVTLRQRGQTELGDPAAVEMTAAQPEDPAQQLQIPESTALSAESAPAETPAEVSAEEATQMGEKEEPAMTEGVLAGKTEEEIAEMALSEEGSSDRLNEDGAPEPID